MLLVLGRLGMYCIRPFDFLYYILYYTILYQNFTVGVPKFHRGGGEGPKRPVPVSLLV